MILKTPEVCPAHTPSVPNLAAVTATYRHANDNDVEPLLLTVKQVQRKLSLGRTKVIELCNEGVLERRHIGRCARITARSVDRLAGNP